VYIGYTNGDRWNGWATPYFTYEEAEKIQTSMPRLLYDVNKDEFRIKYDGDDEPYIWKGEDIQTVDGKLHLYGIGAYSHIWDEVGGTPDKRYLAEIISDFLYECDPYTYSDERTEPDEVIDSIIAQFADIETFAKAHNIMNNATLGSDEIINKLNEVLRI
jgi:hypothetical protein